MAKKILRINMGALSFAYEEVPGKWAKWAGRGLTSAIVADEVDPTCHPLGPCHCPGLGFRNPGSAQQWENFIWREKPSYRGN